MIRRYFTDTLHKYITIIIMAEIDNSYEIFKSKIVEFKKYGTEPISESDTRSKIIDRLFKDVLGWTENDIERERFVQVGFYDYEISTSIFRFVVEAKKTFVEFKIPEKTRRTKIKTIYKANKEVMYPLHQPLIVTVKLGPHLCVYGK